MMCFSRASYIILYVYVYFMLGFVKLDDSDILGISLDSCRFELHTSQVTWEEAYKVCKLRGLTLASLSAKSEVDEVKFLVDSVKNVFSSYITISSSLWIGLRMESTSRSTSEFHWGDCTTILSITKSFDQLKSFTEATGCGYVSYDSIRLTRCDNTESMGFICENPNGVDSCFSTKSTTMYALGYKSKTALASSDCATECITSSCGAIYISSGDSCTLMSYKSGLSSSLSQSQLASTYYYHRRLFHDGPIPSVSDSGLSEDDLCSLPIGSPIVTTALNDVTTTELITPTSIGEATSQPITTQPTPEVTTTEDSTTQPTQEVTTNDITTQINNGVSTTITEYSTFNFSSCVCVCVEKNETLEEKIEKIVSELKVDTSVLSSTKRRKSCAEDPRPTAKSLGMFGVAIFALLLGFIISVDIIRFLQYVNRCCKQTGR
ncbi:uncharacterized protein LOC111116021 [Crassostrea virginica]